MDQRCAQSEGYGPKSARNSPKMDRKVRAVESGVANIPEKLGCLLPHQTPPSTQAVGGGVPLVRHTTHRSRARWIRKRHNRIRAVADVDAGLLDSRTFVGSP
jgi:hypothetical protein